MKQGRESTSSNRGVVHTLAQFGTKEKASTPKNRFVLVSGNGSDAGDLKTTRSRAKRKLVSQVMALELIKIAVKNKNTTLEKRFRNTYYCLDTVRVANGRIYGKFCKNRVCTVCLAIRKAVLIHQYYESVSEWQSPQLLTLTVKSIKAGSLRAVILQMKQIFNKIIEKHKKRNQRGKGPKLMGIYSIESNFNPKKRTYNPHFHIITNNRETAEILLSEWIIRAKPKKVLRRSQDLTAIYDSKKALIEVIKYGSKIFTENDLDKRIREKSKRSIYIQALYTIVEAFNCTHVFEHFGFKPKKSVKPTYPAQVLTEFETYSYTPTKRDWMNETGVKPLTGYIPPDELIEILEKRINTDLY